MRLSGTYALHGGVEVWRDRDLYEWITDVLEEPGIRVQKGVTTEIRSHIKQQLLKEGWAFDVKVDAESDLTVFSRKDDLAIQLQTGNISRYAYDLLKLELLYTKKEIEAAALIVPTGTAALKLGSNIANIDRIWKEANIFDRVINIPIMFIAFE